MKEIIIARSILHSIGDEGTLFSRGNITTHAARSSEEILNLHGVHRADLIITDVGLPLMGASALCSAIRSNQDLKNVSIIAVCEGTPESIAQCRDVRANAVLPKPIDRVQFFSKISELLVIPQRKDLRSLLRLSVQGNQGENGFFAMSHNISISGMLIESDHVLKEGDKFFCTFNISHSEIRTECMIMRAQTVSGRRKYGVKFLNSDTKSLVIIDQFVKSQTKQ